MLAFMTFGTISFVDKTTGTESVRSLLSQAAERPVEAFGVFGVMTLIALLFFAGATGKSAQIPLYVWLPDAMAGPTPVSALIHAATMVTAGVYLVARCSSIFVKSPTALLVVAVAGAATALFAATIGLAQNDIKKVLAYSTISQLGYMFLACGVGAFTAGIFHVMTHAFFKALLFLGAGSVIHGMHDEQDLRRMGGLKKYLPYTFGTMLVAWLAISGFPLMSGFFSKDEILWRTWETAALPAGWGRALWFVAAVTALLTAIYMTRLMVMTFWGEERFSRQPQGDHGAAGRHDAETKERAALSQDQAAHGQGHVFKPHESPAVMLAPLVILALLSIFGGFVGVPPALSSLVGIHAPNRFEQFLEPAIATPHPQAAGVHEGTAGGAPGAETQNAAAASEHGEEMKAEQLFTLVSSLVALVGLSIGWLLFTKNPLRRMPRLLENKYYVDEIYDATVITPIEEGSRHLLWRVVDVKIIDGFVNGVARVFGAVAGTLRYLQTGFARSYAAVILLGAIVVIGYFALR